MSSNPNTYPPHLKRSPRHSGPKSFKRAKGFTQYGLHGALLTVDLGREEKAAREVLDLFNDIAELFYPKETNHPDSHSTHDQNPDLEQQLIHEINQLQNPSHRFQVVKSGCRNIVFIRFIDQDLDPISFIHKTFEYITQDLKQSRTRYTNRIIPIQKTCPVKDELILQTATPLIEQIFHGTPKKCYTFMVDLAARNHTNIIKDDIKSLLASQVGLGHFVDLKQPKQIIIVQIFQKTCGISIVPGEILTKYRRYNIRMATEHLPGGQGISYRSPTPIQDQSH